VPEEAEVKVEVEQNNKINESLADDGTTGIQSVLDAASSVVSLSGATTKKSVPADGLKKPTRRNLVHPRGRRWPQKLRNLVPPSDDQVLWIHLYELYRYKADHGTTTVPWSKHCTNNIGE
jgi:hypothetical protein